MGDAQKVRRDTITAVDKLDESLTTEYQNLESLDNGFIKLIDSCDRVTSDFLGIAHLICILVKRVHVEINNIADA